jgi:TnpA family transposase
VELRQAIEKQLNKGENANQFSKAISFGNHYDFLYDEKVEQELAEGCRRLIQNAIICWNTCISPRKSGRNPMPNAGKPYWRPCSRGLW